MVTWIKLEKNMGLTNKNLANFKLLWGSLRNWGTLGKVWGTSSNSHSYASSKEKKRIREGAG